MVSGLSSRSLSHSLLSCSSTYPHILPYVLEGLLEYVYSLPQTAQNGGTHSKRVTRHNPSCRRSNHREVIGARTASANFIPCLIVVSRKENLLSVIWWADDCDSCTANKCKCTSANFRSGSALGPHCLRSVGATTRAHHRPYVLL